MKFLLHSVSDSFYEIKDNEYFKSIATFWEIVKIFVTAAALFQTIFFTTLGGAAGEEEM